MEVGAWCEESSATRNGRVWRQDIDEKNLAIVVNRQHPHWRMLEGENSIENYLPHCVYNGVAEHRAARKKRLESDTVKRLKDNYLRVVFELLQSAEDEENGTG